ncbi:MAG: TonB-dependent receptor [Alphaproteobacteria bacterium]|nr:TonB-dependent receptor [Alphaproteobacteria bacterium]OJU56062.1 MAG: hypothetical protein BGO00_06380 [Alphaproteobacteria bacterium 62-8]
MTAALVPAAGAAWGQDSAPKSEYLEEVVVTATKWSRNAQDVPISLEVVSQRKLEEAGVSDLLNLSAKVPGLSVRTGNAGNVIRIRGIGTGSFGYTEQSVALYKDGIFMGKGRQNSAPFFDVQRLEILRGPQGALIGKNSSAGAINIVSNNPTDVFEAGLTANYLIDYKGVDLFGYVSGPLSDTLNGRVAIKYKKSDGALRNFDTGRNEPDNESIQGRVTLEFTPASNVTMLTKFEYTDVTNDGHNFFGLPLTIPTYKDARDYVIKAGGYSVPPMVSAKPDGTPVILPDGDSLKQYDFSNTLTVDAEDLTFVAISGFTAYNSTMSTAGRHAGPVETINTSFLEDFKQVSQEFRLQSQPGGVFEWVVGVYGDWSELKYLNPLTFNLFTAAGAPLSRSGAHTDYSMTAYSYSVYGTGTWHITDTLGLIVGGRYTGVQKSGSLEYIHDYLTAGIQTTPEFGPYTDSFLDSHFDPSVTLQYYVTPQIMVYATYGQGSKPGTLQSTRTTTLADFRLKQEVTTSYEVGVKSVLDDFLILNATAFHMTMDNYQVGQYVTDLNGLPALRATNAATVISRGFELSATASLERWIEGLTLSLTGSYTDAYFDDYPGASCTVAAVAAGCVSGQPFIGGELFNGAGLPLQLISKWTGTLSADYTRPISDALKIQFAISSDMFSKYYFDSSSYSDTNGLQPSEMMLNLRLALSDRDDRWSLAFIGDNLTNVWRGGQAYTYPGYPGTVRVYGIYGGRNLMLQGSVKF